MEKIKRAGQSNVVPVRETIKLVDIYFDMADSLAYLFTILGERDPVASISHQKMPTWCDHVSFVRSNPYAAWYLIKLIADDTVLGALYLTHHSEIGISLLRKYQGQGYGKRAIRMLMAAHPRPRYLANIAPGNHRSIQFFDRLGFQTLQITKEFKKDI
jgi:RimJ/RimL family protein N-acetyltransferase